MKKIVLCILLVLGIFAPISAAPSTKQEIKPINVSGFVLDENGEIVRYVNTMSRDGYSAYVTLQPGESFQTYQYQSKDFIGAIGSFSTSTSSTNVTVTVRRSNSVGGTRTNACSYIANPTVSPNLSVGHNDYWGCETTNTNSVYYDVIYKNTGSVTTKINFQVFYGIINIS